MNSGAAFTHTTARCACFTPRASCFTPLSQVLDFSQEDLEQDDVNILDCYDRVYVWVGSENDNEREARLSMETAAAYITQQAKLDHRPTSNAPILVKAGEEPLDFTKEFVGWSKNNGPKWEDPGLILKFIFSWVIVRSRAKAQAQDFFAKKTLRVH